MSRRIEYDDAWIMDNYIRYPSVKELLFAYNEEHNTEIQYDTFKCKIRRLPIFGFSVNRWTEEQEQWMRDNVPTLGRHEAYKRFCEMFGNVHTEGSFVTQYKRIGIQVDKDVWHENSRIANTEYNSGDIMILNGKPFVKMSDRKGYKGYKTLGAYVYEQAHGEIPKDHILIYLDGDRNNVSLDNLKAIPMKYYVTISHHNKWLGKKDITECGIKYCELINEIKKMRSAE